MRFLPHLLAALLAITTLTTQVASACGDYVEYNPPPRVLAISKHHPAPLPGHYTYTAGRTVVVLEQTTNHGLPLATPTEVTLVGPAGTRVVKSGQQVALRTSRRSPPNAVALEVPTFNRDNFAIAIAGRVPDAKWHALDAHKTSAKTLWWLAQQGIKHVQHVSVRTIHGTGLELIGYAADRTHFIVREGDLPVGLAADARPLGAVSTAGRTFLVFSTDEQIGLLELPATTKV